MDTNKTAVMNIIPNCESPGESGASAVRVESRGEGATLSVASGISDGTQASAASHGREMSGSSCETKQKEPLCIIVLGMAGSGKTSFVKRLDSHLNIRKPHYVINLDPAVDSVPYMSYIDIRDTVNYKEVMKQYGLGPNGGIVTSLNLFSTMFDDVLKLIAKREKEIDYIIFDTPGQIEVFNWSASGSIIAEALAATYPTIIIYVLDTVRSTNPQTFMSNMLYACSILYKYKLPFIIAMNKIDIVDCKYAENWLQDYDEFYDALSSESTYAANLTRSLSLALEEFYSTIKACGVSAFTGEGMDAFMRLADEAAIEFEDYRADCEKLKRKKKLENEKRQKNILGKIDRDLQEEGLCSVRKAIREDTDIFLSHASESEEEREELDEDDTEEKKELESFQSFLTSHKTKMENQRKKFADSTNQ